MTEEFRNKVFDKIWEELEREESYRSEFLEVHHKPPRNGLEEAIERSKR